MKPEGRLSLVVALLTLWLLLAACAAPRAAMTPTAQRPNPCGDGRCDAAEQRNPNLCPQDCPSPTVAVTALPPASPHPAAATASPTAHPLPQGQPSPTAVAAHSLGGGDLLTAVPAAASGSLWQYETTFQATLPQGQPYDRGAFCRLFPRADGEGYEVVFGGSFTSRDVDAASRYEGVVHRRLGDDLTFQGPPERFTSHGGDLAIDSDGTFYYLLTAHPQGWVLGKYDAGFRLVKEVVVPLPKGHAANDQMLRVWQGRLYLSDLYNPHAQNGQPQGKASADEVLYTHLWIYDTDLQPLTDMVLDDAPNINGGTLIPYESGFAYIAADNFLTNRLYAHLYTADGGYIRSLLLEENAQWSMGGAVADGKIYIAYHRGQHQQGDVWVDTFDMQWQPLERLPVTAGAPHFNAQRPWVTVLGNRMFVTYDVSASGDPRNLQCLVSVYRRK